MKNAAKNGHVTFGFTTCFIPRFQCETLRWRCWAL